MDNLNFNTKKYLPSTLTTCGVGLMMSSYEILSKRLKTIGVYGWTGDYFKRYREQVLKSLYTNNKRKMKGIPMRRKVLIRKWWRALK